VEVAGPSPVSRDLARNLATCFTERSSALSSRSSPRCSALRALPERPRGPRKFSLSFSWCCFLER
jgi:hypothetical protein